MSLVRSPATLCHVRRRVWLVGVAGGCGAVASAARPARAGGGTAWSAMAVWVGPRSAADSNMWISNPFRGFPIDNRRELAQLVDTGCAERPARYTSGRLTPCVRAPRRGAEVTQLDLQGCRGVVALTRDLVGLRVVGARAGRETDPGRPLPGIARRQLRTGDYLYGVHRGPEGEVSSEPVAGDGEQPRRLVGD